MYGPWLYLNGPSPIFPVEICESIIDSIQQLHTYGDLTRYRTLGACALTCRAWLPRSRFNLFQHIELTSRTRFYSFAKLLTNSPDLAGYVNSVVLTSDLKLMCSFPAVFTQKLPQLKWLVFAGDWTQDKVLPVHPTFYLALSTFASVTELDLYDLKFRNFRDFASLICILPNLSRLVCSAIKWKRIGGDLFINKQYQHILKLDHLHLDRSDFLAACRLLSAVQTPLSRLYLGFNEDVSDSKIQENMNLARFHSLRAIRINLLLPAVFTDCTWVPSFLSTITSPHVDRVIFRYRYDVDVEDIDFDKVLDLLDHQRIEEILARTQFSGLQRVEFMFRRAFCEKYGYDRENMLAKLGERFAKLRARGVLDVFFHP